MGDLSYWNHTGDQKVDKEIRAFGRKIFKDVSGSAAYNRLRLEQIAFAMGVFVSIIEEDDVITEYKLHDPQYTSATITIEGETVEYYGTKLFSQAVALADRIEMSQTNRENVRMRLIFDGITSEK